MRFSVGSGSGTLSIAEYGEKPLDVSGYMVTCIITTFACASAFQFPCLGDQIPLPAHITDNASLKYVVVKHEHLL